MKNQLKKTLIPLLANHTVSAIAHRFVDHCIPIFMVHRVKLDDQNISGITEDHLRNCLRYLDEDGYNPVSLEDLILALKNQTRLPDNAVVFTMDDGYIDQALLAAPVFIEFGCPVTFFVITRMLDNTLWPWDAKIAWIINETRKTSLEIDLQGYITSVELGNSRKQKMAREKIRRVVKELDNERIPGMLIQLAEAADVSIPESAPPEFQPLDWKMARELETKGVTFAPHTETHRVLSKLNKKSMEREILGSWETLERELANPLKVLCYPTGRNLDFGPREVEFLKEKGFLGAVSTSQGVVDIQKKSLEQSFYLPRLALPGNITDFIQYCSWINAFFRN